MTTARSGRGKGQWLKTEVIRGKLVISVGIDVLAFAAQQRLDEQEFERSEGHLAEFIITDEVQFARDVCSELLREDEAGSNPIHFMLDAAFDKAVEMGSLGISDRSECSSEDCGSKP